jgi:uncharacterized protein (TIGR04255 family)
MSGFIIGMQSPYDDGRDMLHLQLTTGDTDTPDSVVVILDMDYFIARQEAVPIPEALDWIEMAHTRVQDVFEACLTDRLRQTFLA